MLLEAWLLWLIPLVSAPIVLLIGKVNNRATGYVSVVIQTIVSVLAAIIFYKFNFGLLETEELGEHVIYVERIPFISSGVVDISFGIFLDPFSILMVLIVSYISLFIFIYALGYMEGEKDLGRYWFWKNFFVGSMLLLVVSVNLIQMFMAWEMVGLCSWALISFWYKKTNPSDVPGFKTEGQYNAHCGFKALVTTSFADGFTIVALAIIGISTLSSGKITFDIVELSKNYEWLLAIYSMGLLPIFSGFLISGALGKSAQFPYHEWLPEAMAGPTTVSALIHSATMVKAGAYFVGRIFLIMYDAHVLTNTLPPAAFTLFFEIALFFGLATAILAGLYGIVAKELKKVLAFSTISQLSYIFMMFGAAGLLLSEHAFAAGAAHILTHSIFKALLFLSAGAIIHAIHSKYLYDMGNLRKYIPVTYFATMVGAFSLMGVPLFAGFWSKELMLHAIHDMPLWFVVLFVSTFLLTVIYTMRMIGLVFFGKESEHAKKMIQEHKVHDPPFVMKFSLVALSLLAILSVILVPWMLEFLEKGRVFFDFEAIVIFLEENLLSMGTLISLGILAVGGLPTYMIYFQNKIDPAKIVNANALTKTLYMFMYERWILNPLYYKVVDAVKFSVKYFAMVKPALDWLYAKIAKIGPLSANVLRKFQTGDLRINVMYILAMLLIFLLFLI